jgi:hypothetical protein
MNVRIMHPRADRGLDFYETPVCAVDALLRVETLPHYLWEPCAGNGAIARVLREAGHVVTTSDIIHRNFELTFEGDFFEQSKAPARTELIISNPPFMHGTRFVEHALELCSRVIVLARINFLASKRRCKILDTGMLVTVYPFIERLPMMHRDGWTGRRTSSAVDYAWFVFWRDHGAPATIERISIHPEEQAFPNDRE